MAHLLLSVALPDAFAAAPPPRGLKLIRSETFRRLRTRSARLAARDGLIVSFTVPARPIRRRLRELPPFVVTRGGEYCFVPGLRAMRWLAELEP